MFRKLCSTFHYLCAPCFGSVSAIIYFTVLVYDRFSTAASLSCVSVQRLAAITKQYEETRKPWG